eukprot:Lithocolla_globosa_v1_NODE_1158_length_2825_cov_73.262094.p2 type:complete len:364 gc:universal NODE_1158_length_2825_cov_73.262094:1711-2802(+)
MSTFDHKEHPHRRLNLLTSTWLICSPHRAKRPWLGQTEETGGEKLATYDPKCFLCPGNVRASGGKENDKYENTFVFTNDFAALLPDSPIGHYHEADENAPTITQEDSLLVAQSIRGTCRVVCFSPNHSLTMPVMEDEQIIEAFRVVVEQYKELGKEYECVQFFENKGAVMGCSNPHPHGQVWASDSVPEELKKELESFKKWRQTHDNQCLLCAYLALEIKKQERIVIQTAEWVVLVPFWAYWPFEVIVLPTWHVSRMSELTPTRQASLALVLKQLCIKYDNLFKTSFPYSMGVHEQPRSDCPQSDMHLHLHYYPPLLRNAEVKKFQVGYELVADWCRDITAEQAADQLRQQSDTHYSQEKTKQ